MTQLDGQRPPRPLAGTLVVALALCLLLAAWYLHRSALAVMRAHAWSALNQPVQLRPGQVLAAAFATDLDEHYDIAIEVERRLPQQEIACLLGIEASAQQRCAGVSPIGEIRWAVRSGDRVVASGSSLQRGGGTWSARHVGRSIGGFRGAPDGRYELVVEGTSEEPRLNEAHPTLHVSVAAPRFKKAVVAAQFRELAAATVGVVGLLMLAGAGLVALYRRIRQER